MTYELRRRRRPDDEEEDSDALVLLKCALLTVEAALPLGAMFDEPEEARKTIKLRRDEMPKWVKRV